jgi:hypothetical protein
MRSVDWASHYHQTMLDARRKRDLAILAAKKQGTPAPMIAQRIGMSVRGVQRILAAQGAAGYKPRDRKETA